MQKIQKSIVILLLCGLVLSIFTGCTEKENKNEKQTETKTDTQKNEQSKEQDPEEKTVIGVTIYDPYAADFLMLKEYFDQLEGRFDVTFMYSSGITSELEEMEFIDSCSNNGAVGVIGYYNYTGKKQAEKVLAQKMFYMDNGKYPEIYETYQENEWYLGTVDRKQFDYESGKLLAEWVKENNFKKVVYGKGDEESGGNDYEEIDRGFTESLESAEVEALILPGLKEETFFEQQEEALREVGVEAVIATFGGFTIWNQPMIGAGLEGIASLAVIDVLNEENIEAMKNGEISYLVMEDVKQYGVIAALIVNAHNGNAEEFFGEKSALKIPDKPIAIKDSEELNEPQNNLEESIQAIKDLIKL